MKRLIILSLAIPLSACAGFAPERTTLEPTPAEISGVTTETSPLSQTSVQPQGLKEIPGTLVASADHAGHTEHAMPAAHAEPAAHAVPAAHAAHADHAAPKAAKENHDARHAGAVPPEKALSWLKNGNNRFVKQGVRKDGQSSKDIVRLSTGQQPHTIVLSCSDSRVPPEIVFDQKLGEIFVVRTAGESLDAMAIASIEYAVSHLGANLIVVMGHESCGAVKAAHSTLEGADAGSPSLNKLVADIHPRIMSFKGKSLTKGGISEGWANVKGVAKDLLERSTIIKEAAESGSIQIKNSLYHLGDGKVEWE